MLLSNKDLTKLKKHPDYKRTNKVPRNVRFAINAVRAKGGSFATTVFDTVEGPTFKKSLFLCWPVMKYLYIAKEMIRCRSTIIEQALRRDSAFSVEQTVRRAIKPFSCWLDESEQKLDLLEAACLDYLDREDIMEIIKDASSLESETEKTSLYQAAQREIQDAFETIKEEYRDREYQKHNITYLESLKDPKKAAAVRTLYLESGRFGLLTAPEPTTEHTDNAVDRQTDEGEHSNGN